MKIFKYLLDKQLMINQTVLRTKYTDNHLHSHKRPYTPPDKPTEVTPSNKGTST